MTVVWLLVPFIDRATRPKVFGADVGVDLAKEPS